MYAFWHPVAARGSAMTATLHGLLLRVDEKGDRCWHWAVLTTGGYELESGDAPSLMTAEAEAENEVLSVHPPGGRWIERAYG